MSALWQEAADREEVAETVSDVLSRREFQEERNLLEDFLEWLGERLDLGQGSALIGELLFWLLLAMVVGLTAYFGLRFLAAGRLRRRLRLDSQGHQGPSVVERVAELRREAADALAAGDLKLALRKNLFALILGLGNRGDLQYRDAWTNRELLERGRPAANMKDMLVSVITELEPKEFGREEVQRADVERMVELCERHLGKVGGTG